MRQIYKTVSNQKPKTTVKNLTEIESSYIAGMIDGDGSICKSKNRDNLTIKIRVHNSDKNLMDWLIKTIGAGSISYLPPSIENKGYKHTLTRWTYDISSKVDVARLLQQIEPYLLIKKIKAQNILILIKTMKRPTKYEKRVNQNG